MAKHGNLLGRRILDDNEPEEAREEIKDSPPKEPSAFPLVQEQPATPPPKDGPSLGGKDRIPASEIDSIPPSPPKRVETNPSTEPLPPPQTPPVVSLPKGKGPIPPSVSTSEQPPERRPGDNGLGRPTLPKLIDPSSELAKERVAGALPHPKVVKTNPPPDPLPPPKTPPAVSLPEVKGPIPPSVPTSEQPPERRPGDNGLGRPKLPEVIDTSTGPGGNVVGDPYPPRGKWAEKKPKVVTKESEFEATTLQATFITGLRKIYLWGLAILASFLGFYTITQTTNFIVQLKDCPPLVKYPLYVAVVFFAMGIVCFIWQLLRSWLKMKRSPQVSLGMLSALAKRRELREKCHQKTKEACDELYAIINDIKEKKDEYEKTLKTMHFSEETICYLFDSINDLCNRHLEHKKGGGREASSEWIARFTEKYQTTLDALANERIKFYSYRGGVAAMVSRIPAIDRFIVLSAMFSLVKDLLAIYNVKPSRTNTVILFSKVIIKTFCAGYIQEGAEKFGDGFKKAFAVSGIAFANIPFLKGITSLSVEAVAHGFLIYRIGKTAQKMLQPVLRDEK